MPKTPSSETVTLGTPLKANAFRVLFCGAGELGKEVVIELQRLGVEVIAVDRYANAPAMQVAHRSHVIDMLDGAALRQVVEAEKPDLIVPEIEAIATPELVKLEQEGYKVIPTARAVNLTMNREGIRVLAAEELGLATSPYRFAETREDYLAAVESIGLPLVVKPVMSSSGKGQSTVKAPDEIERAWEYAQTGGRAGKGRVIVEGFVDFDFEITLLTLTQKEGPTLFCPPIGHRQERGDYQESWQPQEMTEEQLSIAQEMADQITRSLGGAGIWGVEFFVSSSGVYFSELSPRPHDTGMVTLAGTQNFNEFELHARAVLGWPIPKITQERFGANAVILSEIEEEVPPAYSGMKKAAEFSQSDFRIFGKPICRKYRRMGVALTYDSVGSDMLNLRKKAKTIADTIRVHKK
jgi:phosphoribosylglycinamide formyltransferase 2